MARFPKQQDVSVETNCTDKAQDVATIFKKENVPERNILMEVNSIDNDAEPTSINEQIPEASTIVDYSDSPTTSRDILSQEDCFLPSTSYAVKKKYECVTARDIVCYDHHYEDTPCTMKRKFNVLRKKNKTNRKYRSKSQLSKDNKCNTHRHRITHIAYRITHIFAPQ